MKDAYYFPHDSNAKDDPKCILLIEQLGLEGYGIYWVLIETLRDQPNYRYPINLLPALARRFNTTAEKMKTVVGQYGLFQVENDEFFFSQSLINRMEVFEKKRHFASIAGKKSAEKRLLLNDSSTDVQQPFNNGSTIKVNKSKVNKSKVNKSKVNKSTYGSHQNVSLSDEEIERLNSEYGASKSQQAIEYLSAYKIEKSYKTKDDNLTLRRWVFDAISKKQGTPQKVAHRDNFNQRNYDDDFYDKLNQSTIIK